jgi:hypothetical protein
MVQTRPRSKSPIRSCQRRNRERTTFMVKEDNLYGGAGPVPNLSLCKLGARARIWATPSFLERSLCPRRDREQRKERA